MQPNAGIAFMNSNVISGSATAVEVSVGGSTLFGSTFSAAATKAVKIGFLVLFLRPDGEYI